MGTRLEIWEATLETDRGYRQRRRRGFDDEDHDGGPRDFGGGAPRFSSSTTVSGSVPSGPAVGAVVKWFNPDKGFGFVELSDGTGDAFLHASVLGRSGVTAVQPGETLEIRVAPGQRGPQVTEVISVDSSTATPAQPVRVPPSGWIAAVADRRSSAPACRKPARSSGSTR